MWHSIMVMTWGPATVQFHTWIHDRISSLHVPIGLPAPIMSALFSLVRTVHCGTRVRSGVRCYKMRCKIMDRRRQSRRLAGSSNTRQSHVLPAKNSERTSTHGWGSVEAQTGTAPRHRRRSSCGRITRTGVETCHPASTFNHTLTPVPCGMRVRAVHIDCLPIWCLLSMGKYQTRWVL